MVCLWVCIVCRVASGKIIPNDWLSSGRPNFDYVDQKFKCADCGETPETGSLETYKRTGEVSRIITD